MKTLRVKRAAQTDVLLVGLGNIGSFAVPHLGRMPNVRRVVLLDRDREYEPGNLRGQDITPTDVGQSPKAQIQARRLRRLNQSLDVRAITDDLRNVPWGKLHARVILGALDSADARLHLGEIAWRWGVPFIDGGVDPQALLGRVTVYWPGDGSPCFECALNEADYQNLALRFPCGGLSPGPAPTNGSSSLGAIVAGVMAIECEKALAGQRDRSLAGRQLVVDFAHHQQYITALRRHPQCRFDHAVWDIAPLRGLSLGHSLADLLQRARRLMPGADPVAVRVPGKQFAKAIHCLACGDCLERFHLASPTSAPPGPCARCGASRWGTVGFKSIEWLDARRPGAVLRRSLRSVGIRPGEVFQIRAAGRERHLVIPNEET